MRDSLSPDAVHRAQSATTQRTLEEEVPSCVALVDGKIYELCHHTVGAKLLGLALMRTQERTWRDTGHLIALNDEYVLRQIRQHAERAEIPGCYVRCMRCQCLALVYDWIWAADTEDDPIIPGHPFPARTAKAVDVAYMADCKGGQIARELMSLLE